MIKISARYKHFQATIADLHSSLSNRDITVTDVCTQSLKLIEDTKALNSFITVCDKEALKLANNLDSQIEDGSSSVIKKNPLFGVPVSIKDNFCTRGTLTTCGSKMLHNFVPPYDATVVSKLKKVNSLIMGKTNMDEFAMGSSCLTSYFGPTSNYWFQDHPSGDEPNRLGVNNKNWYMAGGSSTGSAVSVASGCCYASLGTDTGGSTRQPASFTGTVGFKPTYGLISRHGLIPLAHSLDVVSILTRNCDDSKLVFDTIVGQDDNDLTTVDHQTLLVHRFKEPGPGERLKIRIGISESFIREANLSSSVSNRFFKIIDELKANSSYIDALDCDIMELDLSHSRFSTECYTIATSAEIASNMSCYDGIKYGFSMDLKDSEEFDRDSFYKANRDAGFGAEVKKRILLGNYFLLEQNREKYLLQALKVRRLISDEFDNAFQEKRADIIMTPSTPTTSVTFKDWSQKQHDNKLFHQDYFLIPTNLANRPSISIPCGLSDEGLPIGLQLVADKYHDLDLLLIAKLFQDHLTRTFPMHSNFSLSS